MRESRVMRTTKIVLCLGPIWLLGVLIIGIHGSNHRRLWRRAQAFNAEHVHKCRRATSAICGDMDTVGTYKVPTTATNKFLSHIFDTI